MTAPLTHLQRRLLGAQDAHVSRCRWCGEWRYRRDDCGACGTPAPDVEKAAV